VLFIILEDIDVAKKEAAKLLYILKILRTEVNEKTCAEFPFAFQIIGKDSFLSLELVFIFHKSSH